MFNTGILEQPAVALPHQIVRVGQENTGNLEGVVKAWKKLETAAGKGAK